MITPRTSRLLRAPDLRGVQRAILAALPTGLDARATAVILPTRSAGEALRRTMEDARLGGAAPAAILPRLLTRSDFYEWLHDSSPGLPLLLSEFEREVLLRLAAEDAGRGGATPPFRLRTGLITAILEFYDGLRRRLRTIDSFDRHVRERLEAGSETDRGAARLLEQTLFLSSAFAAFEQRVANSGRIDEHGLRALALTGDVPSPCRHLVVAVADETADPRGLWPCDFDLLARIAGLERLDVVATDALLSTGWLQRLDDALPGMDEQRVAPGGNRPVLAVPAVQPDREPPLWFVARDREEELIEAARWIKHRADDPDCPPLERTAVVFARPLPYLYLARQVFESAAIPYQTHDALPLAAEPFASALDLVLSVLADEPARTSLIDLLASPLWRFVDPAGGRLPERREIAALDRLLQDVKYLGGWGSLRRLAARIPASASAHGRAAALWRRAAPALRAGVNAGDALEPVRAADTASAQIDALMAFIEAHERLPVPEAGAHERHLRARGAVLVALAALRDAHARHDDRAVALPELTSTLRRWIEGQTFAPRAGADGVLLLDAPAAAFASVDQVRLVGLVEPDWPERAAPAIFYPAALLRDLGWPPEQDRLAAARARFQDLLQLAAAEVSVSTFTLEEDATVLPSPFLEDLASSGLLTRHVEPVPPRRIFGHEALMLEPAAEAPLSEDAAAWLAIRRSRTPPQDPRYRGAAGPRPPAVYAVSHVERYLECPFKYFAAHVLQLDEERDDESGLTPRERGQLLHGVFEAFFAAWAGTGRTGIGPEDLDEAVALFAEVADAHLAELPEADRALERTYLLGSAAAPGLAERAFGVEIEHGVPVVERLLEYVLEGRFRFERPDGPRDVQIRGKADRIDLLADGTLRVVDYKLGRAPKPSRALQLPVYGVCAAQQLAHERGRPWPVSRAGYVAFREKQAFTDLSGRGGDVDAALRDGQARFLAAVARIEAGTFPVDPDEPWLCTRCGFSPVCRKDYVGDE